jgi:hypothetical protein
MKLGEFIKEFVNHNSLVRLLYQHEKCSHIIVSDSWNDVSMEHEILNGTGIYRHYINNNVMYIASILTGGHYSEAINIVIEELEEQPFIEEKSIEYHTNVCAS